MKYIKTPQLPFKVAGVVVLFALASSGYAANLLVSIKDSRQKPLKDSVVYLQALNPKITHKNQTLKKGYIRQRNKTYAPFVSVFQKGTAVSFVNQDRFKHHVYSFSKAKKFEIKLYSGKPPRSTLFDKPGPVTLGCNIHDHMLAYAYIVDTPYYAISVANGKAQLKNIPNGKYRLKVWHPYLKTGKAIERNVTIPIKNNLVAIQLDLKPFWRKALKKRLKASKNNSDEEYLSF